MNEWMRHLYSALLCIDVHPKRLMNHWMKLLNTNKTDLKICFKMYIPWKQAFYAIMQYWLTTLFFCRTLDFELAEGYMQITIIWLLII